jgi:hypothetical protein
MKMIDVLLAEMDQEAQSTARVLERVPQAQLSWRPHAKSFSLGQLALHVATSRAPSLSCVGTIASRRIHSPKQPPPPSSSPRSRPASPKRAILGGMDDAKLMETAADERRQGADAMLCAAIIADHVNHRITTAALLVSRMHDVPLLSVYGPTADENRLPRPRRSITRSGHANEGCPNSKSKPFA